MGFFSNLFDTTVKTALIPVAITKDTAKTLVGQDSNTTEKLVESIEKNIDKLFEDEDD